ncbi:hypothetical protein Sbs19_28400 [Sphingobium sp. BS19]|nr:hypothetical protein Sbs19_28400 [Sphingobium sp. BS19]
MGRITDNRADIYQEITDQMIAMIEAGTRPWSKSWNGSTAPNIPLRSTGVPYRGINVLTLWVASMTKGYASPHWLTFIRTWSAFASSLRATAHPSLLDRTMTGTLCRLGSNSRSALT